MHWLHGDDSTMITKDEDAETVETLQKASEEQLDHDIAERDYRMTRAERVFQLVVAMSGASDAGRIVDRAVDLEARFEAWRKGFIGPPPKGFRL